MDIARCHVTGAGYGQLASERAHVRLERIACVLRSGDVIDTKIKGYVAGEDGKTGIRGRLVSKTGKNTLARDSGRFASGFRRGRRKLELYRRGGCGRNVYREFQELAGSCENGYRWRSGGSRKTSCGILPQARRRSVSGNRDRRRAPRRRDHNRGNGTCSEKTTYGYGKREGKG